MKPGICKLCLERRDLVESHFIAKSILKTLREEGDSNPDPVVADAKIALQTSRQMKDELLCRECDNRLGQKGENWLQAHMYTTTGFPMRDALGEIAPANQDGEHARYSVTNVPAIDMEQIGYFAVSLFWRAAIHSWKTTGSVSNRLDFGPYEEEMRKYLIGVDSFPRDVVLFVLLWCGDTPPRSVIAPIEQDNAPGEKRDFRAYDAYVPGIAFNLLVGKRIPKDLSENCSYHNWLIHMNIHMDRGVMNLIGLMNHMSRPSERLKQLLGERKP